MRVATTQYLEDREDRLSTSKAIRAMCADIATIEEALVRLTERVERLDCERAVRMRFEND